MASVKSAIGVLVLVASLIPASVAAAETIVPPGNSAATQYTEQFPTAGGNAKSNTGINGGAGKPPSKVLGAGNAQKLESKGQVGEEVATLAAETAPVSATPSGSGRHPAGGNQVNGGNGQNGQGGQNGAGNTGGGEGNAAGGPRPGGSTAPDSSSGSSGLGEVIAQATGSSNGELGLFLPLILIGTVLWSLYYLRRERRQVS
jgi:hypothetical protein